MTSAPAQDSPLDAEQAGFSHTKRTTVPEMEEILGKEFPVLDQGFVRVVDYMGGDDSIVQAARVSYGKGTRKVNEDKGLIRYLMRHRHTTPFEMCEIKFHVKLPIFVARQWIRHRTANVNEYSARYSILDREFYVPDRDYLKQAKDARKSNDRIAKHESKGQAEMFGASPTNRPVEQAASQSVANMQGRGESVSEEEATLVLERIETDSNRAYKNYLFLLNEDEDGNVKDPQRVGLARELARTALPVNFYTQWYWKTDLHNLLHFLSLRADTHAQYEIRAYAYVISEIVHCWAPFAWEAFEDYVAGGANLSAGGLKVLKRMLAGETVSQEDSGLSKREWRELMAVLEREE